MNKIVLAFIILFAVENCKSLRFLDIITTAPDNTFISEITISYKALIGAYPRLSKDKTSKFKLGAALKFVKGLKGEKFVTSLRKSLSRKMKEELVEEIISIIKEYELSDEETLRSFDVIYNPIKEEPGTVNYSLFMISKAENGRYNMLVADINNSTIVKPNVEYVRNSRSVLGHIYSSEKEKESLKLKGVDYEWLSMILNSHKIKALEAAANFFGIELESPVLPIVY